MSTATLPRHGVDYSNARPDPAALVAAGKSFVVRYLSPSTEGNPAKKLLPGEAAQLHAVGLDIALVWETVKGDMLGGYAAGVAAGKAALAAATALDVPSWVAIYFACDFDATSAQCAGPIRLYLLGVASVIGLRRTGLYGGLRPITYAFDEGLITYGWQTYAWSGGKWDSRAQARQVLNGQRVAGVTVDLDTVVADDFGQWEAEMTTVDISDASVTAIAQAVGKLDTVPNWRGDAATNPAITFEHALGYVGADVDAIADLKGQVAALAAEVTALKTSGVPVAIKLGTDDITAIAKAVVALQGSALTKGAA